MWNIVFFVVWGSSVCLGSSNTTLKIDAELESDFDRIADQLLSTITDAHSPKTLKRQKRSDSDYRKSFTDEVGVFRLESITPVSQLCYRAMHSVFFDVGEVTYAVCASLETSDTPAEVIVGKYENHVWTKLASWFVIQPNSISAFHSNGLIYILVADSGKAKGTDLVKFNLTSMRTIVDHVVYSKPATSNAIWKMKKDGKYNMAIANSASMSTDFSTTIFIYEWLETYFDTYQSLDAYEVRDIEPFHIHDSSYLAVANYRMSINNYEVDSEIFRFDYDRKWISHQRIRTYGAMDFEFFTLGAGLNKEFFLAVANSGDDESEAKSMVYKFAKDIFVPFQCLPIHKASAIASWSTDYAFLLAVASYSEAVYLFQYDGWRFVLSRTQYTYGSMSYGVNSLVFHNVTNNYKKVPILSVSNLENNEPSVFEIGFKHENLLKDWAIKSTDWCFSTMKKVEDLNTDSLIRALDDVIYTDQQETVVIDGDLVFKNGFEVSKIQTPRLKEIVTQDIYDSDMILKLEEISQRLQIVQQKLQNFEHIFNNALKIEGNQVVTGNLKFQDVRFDCENYTCQFDVINTTFLNGEDISNWSKNLVFLDGGNIDGTLAVENINAHSINVMGLIDGVESNTLVTKSGHHIITGHKTFTKDISAQEIDVYGKVDGITLSPSNVLLTTGYQNITGDLFFEEIDTAWMEVTGFVNNRDFSHFMNDVVRSDQSTIINGEKTFHNIVAENLQMSEGSTINGIDIADLWRNALWKDKDQVITAPMVFDSINLTKNLVASKGVNGIDIPGPLIVDINGFANITAPCVFMKPTKMAHLEILNSLNGLKIISSGDQSPQLDILLKSGNQVITGKKTFHTVYLNGDSYVSGAVDGVDLSLLKETTVRKDSTINTNHTWFFNNLEIKGPLYVNKIAGYDLEDIYNRALKLSDKDIPKMTFARDIHIDDLECYNINGINVREDLVLVNEPQILTGTKYFTEIALEENSIALKEINNINVTFLNETILRVGNQVLKSKKLNKNVKTDKLTVKGFINNIPVSEFVTLDEDNLFLHAVELTNVTFQDIEVNNLQIDGTVNGINIDEMVKNTLTNDGNQEVSGKITVEGAIKVLPGTELKIGTINDVDITELWNDAVFIDTPTEISGRKIFTESVTFNDLELKGTIDGVSDKDMQNWMLKDKFQIVQGDVTFINDLSVDNLNVNGLINGINITELNDSIVKLNEESVVEGPVIFENTVISLGDVTLTGKIQGVKLSDEAITKSMDKILIGSKTFTKDLTVDELTVDGLIDGVSIKDLCENTLLPKKDQNLTHVTIKGDVILVGGCSLKGKIAGMDLQELQRLVGLHDNSVSIDGHKVFENLTIEGPITIDGLFGGVDLYDLNKNYLSLSRDQDILAPMEFEEATFRGALSARNFSSDNNFINGIDIKNVNERILKKYGTQTITAEYYFDEVIFTDDVFVSGKVNGLEVPGGLMRRGKPNYIQSPKIFEKPLTVLGDLDMSVGRLIQGVDISEWNSKAVLKEGNFKISGHKTFKSLDVIDARVEGLLDGLKISEESLLLISGDQVITGKKTLKSDNVEIRGSLTVNGLVNGVDLNYLISNTLQKDKVNTITGAKYFNKPLTVQSLEAPSVSGIDVVQLEKKINTHLDYELTQNRLEEIEKAISSVKDTFSKQAVIFQYYELFQEFNIPRAYSWHYLSTEDAGEILLLSDNSSSTDSCSTVRLFSYNKEKNKFLPHSQELTTSFATDVKSLVIGKKTYLFVGNKNPKSWCYGDKSEGDSESDIYVWQDGHFSLYQTITTPPIINLEVFNAGDLSCVIYIDIRLTNLYCLSSEGKFTHREILPTIGCRRAVVNQHKGKVILATATEDLRPRTNYYVDEKAVDVYFWDFEKGTFARPVQDIPSSYVQSLLLINQSTDYSSDLFLILGEGKIPKIQDEPRILIYRYDEITERFLKLQELNDNGELQWLSLQTGELVLFVLNMPNGKINLYEYKGASGFVHVDTINSIGTVSVHPFVRRHDPEDSINHYLALAGPRALMAQPTQGVDYAKILKSKVKGRRYFLNH